MKTRRCLLGCAAVLVACSAPPTDDTSLRRATSAITTGAPRLDCRTPEPGVRAAPPLDAVAAKVKAGTVPASVKAAGKIAGKRDHAAPGPMPTQSLDRQLKRAAYFSEFAKLKTKVSDPVKLAAASAELKQKMLGD